MPFEKVLTVAELPIGSKKVVKLGDDEILLIHTAEGTLHAVESKCPHAGAPLVEGAVCHGRLVCPWHMGTFALNGDGLPEGTVIEPPPLRSLRHYATTIDGDSILLNGQPLNSPSLAHYNDTAPALAASEDKRHIITIGGGAASAAAVCALRQGGFTGRLSVIDPVSDEPLDRTALSKMALAGKKPLDKLPLWSPDEAAKLQVERVQGAVTTLDGEAGTLRLADGRELHFDAALLAPGGKPKKPGLPGEALPHVFTIRHAADVAGIAALLGEQADNKKAILLGDSFIAFEAASALKGRGLAVTVVAREEQPFAKKFGEAAAKAITALHEKNGVTLKLGAEASQITATGVTLQNGETLPADLVVIAIGVQPATDFTHGLKLQDDGGVVVDDSLRAAPKLWVAGDIASVNGTRIEHWRLAQQHGRVAASAMLAAGLYGGVEPQAPNADAPAAKTPRYTGIPFFWTAHFGKRFGYVGHAETWDELQIDGSPAEQQFLAYYVKGGVVQAVLGCGKDTAIAALAESLRGSKLALAEARTVAAG